MYFPRPTGFEGPLIVPSSLTAATCPEPNLFALKNPGLACPIGSAAVPKIWPVDGRITRKSALPDCGALIGTWKSMRVVLTWKMGAGAPATSTCKSESVVGHGENPLPSSG